MSSEPRRARAGFTAVELLVVIGIMMILLGIAVPSVMPAIRRGKVNDAANDITDCWRQARALAITTRVPPGATPPHFGIAIDQTTGQRPNVSVVFDNTATGARIYVRGMDPTDSSTWGISGTAVWSHTFSRQVVLAFALNAGDTPTVADHRIVIYAQYGTGLPISPASVIAGQGLIASPSSFGVDTSTVGTATECPGLRIQTLDYTTTPAKRGYAILYSLFHAGFTSVREP